ncbi:MAG: esterase-like activity of phytase family protein [Pseudomonadota bacterium]
MRARLLFLLLFSGVLTLFAAVAYHFHGHGFGDRRGTPLPVGVWTPIQISSSPIPLRPDGAIGTEPRRGKLIFRGGLRLTSDNPAFGGFSGLHLADDGSTLTALSDRGFWLTAQIAFDERGRLTDLTRPRMALLTDKTGRALSGIRSDAEGLHRDHDGFLVSFEREPRVEYHKKDQTGIFRHQRDVADYREVSALQSNQSLEGVTRLGDGTLLVSAENTIGEPDVHRLYLDPDTSVDIKRTPPFDITEIAYHNGDLYFLERHYDRTTGQQIRLSVIDRFDPNIPVLPMPSELARFDDTDIIDNFEGLTLHTDQGKTHLFIISDDNFSDRQDTLLLHFSLVP